MRGTEQSIYAGMCTYEMYQKFRDKLPYYYYLEYIYSVV